MNKPKTDFEKLIIAKQYIAYQKKRILELEDELYKKALLIEELKIEAIQLKFNKKNQIQIAKNKFNKRFIKYEKDYSEVRDFINNEIAPKAFDDLLYLYRILDNIKIRALKRQMKGYFNFNKFVVGKLVFSNDEINKLDSINDV